MDIMKRRIKERWSNLVKSTREKMRGEFIPFVKLHHDTLLAVFIPVITALFAYSIYILSAKINSFSFLWYWLHFVTFLVLIYCFFWKRIIGWVNRHNVFINLFSIFVAVFLFAWQQSINDRNELGKVQNELLGYEVSLKEENNRNNSHLESILADLPPNDNVMFWRDFSTKSYVELWKYIHLYKSQDCKNLFMALTVDLDVLNNINKMRREVALLPLTKVLLQSQVNRAMIDAASSTKPVLDKIIGRCQS